MTEYYEAESDGMIHDIRVLAWLALEGNVDADIQLAEIDKYDMDD